MKVLIISPEGELHKAESSHTAELLSLAWLGYQVINYENENPLQLKDGDWCRVSNFKVTSEELAEKMYHRHYGRDVVKYPYMWKQCSEEYRQAWITIAEVKLEGIE